MNRNKELSRQFNKKPNITVKSISRTSSTIDEKTYLHRINLIYFQNKKVDQAYEKNVKDTILNINFLG